MTKIKQKFMGGQYSLYLNICDFYYYKTEI